VGCYLRLFFNPITSAIKQVHWVIDVISSSVSGGKAGHRKRHEKQAERLPPVGQCGLDVPDAQHQRKTDQRADAGGIEPDAGCRVEVVCDRVKIPDQITSVRLKIK
jgi:hypothetical protein